MNERSYKAAREEAAYFDRAQMGLIRVRGEDRVDFLQRQSTNDMRLLTEDRALLNVLTTPTARIIEVFQMMGLEETIELLTLSGSGQKAFDFLKSRIFFMDKVEIVDASDEVSIFDVEGPQSEAILATKETDLPKRIGEWREIRWDGRKARLIMHAGLTSNNGFRFLLQREDREPYLKALEELGIGEMNGHVHEILRVEAGSPLGTNELNGEYTPLELSLMTAISDNKGCYTGQEVIARQITYDKVSKRLVRLRLGGKAALGGEVWYEGKKIGRITSAAESPEQGFLALGVVRVPYDEPGTTVLVKDEDGEIEATVDD